MYALFNVWLGAFMTNDSKMIFDHDDPHMNLTCHIAKGKTEKKTRLRIKMRTPAKLRAPP